MEYLRIPKEIVRDVKQAFRVIKQEIEKIQRILSSQTIDDE